jgi:sortase family protein
VRGTTLAIATGLAAVATAVAVQLHAHRSGARDAKPVPVVDRGTVPSAGPPATGTTAAHAADRRNVEHVVPAGSRLQLRRLDVDAPIVPVRVADGVMEIPRDPHTVGWRRGGAGPGDTTGSVVVVGHINYAGTTGALAVLPNARPGDTVVLDEPGTDRAYRVDAVRTYPKTSGIPAAAFSTTGAPRLALITCGGPFDAQSGNYEDNIVVYASPA